MKLHKSNYQLPASLDKLRKVEGVKVDIRQRWIENATEFLVLPVGVARDLQ